MVVPKLFFRVFAGVAEIPISELLVLSMDFLELGPGTGIDFFSSVA